MEVRTLEHQKMKERPWGKKINYQHETHLPFDGKDSEAVTCTDGLRAEKGQAKDRAQGLSWALLAAALLLTWAWSWAAGEGRRLGKFHGRSSDFSMKQNYSKLAWKAKVIPKENIHTVLLWDYAASICSWYVLNTTIFSFTICCIYYTKTLLIQTLSSNVCCVSCCHCLSSNTLL